MKIKVIKSFETSESTNPATQRHFSKYLNLYVCIFFKAYHTYNGGIMDRGEPVEKIIIIII